MLLVVWEWIGATSFFLVKFWSMRVSSLRAGLKVFTMSQCGDLAFVCGCASLVAEIGSSDVGTINVLGPAVAASHALGFAGQVSLVALWAISILTAMWLKAAQVVFFPWLIDAMEAPVPISAQLHSSTLVIVGFYLTYRLSDVVLAWR